MRQHCAFGPAGGARGVKDRGQIVCRARHAGERWRLCGGKSCQGAVTGSSERVAKASPRCRAELRAGIFILRPDTKTVGSASRKK